MHFNETMLQIIDPICNIAGVDCKRYWDTPFKIHTPRVEDFRKVCHRCSVNYQMQIYLLCGFITEGVYIFYLEVPNELIYLEFTLPCVRCFLNLPQGVCGIQMGLPFTKIDWLMKGTHHLNSHRDTVRKPFSTMYSRDEGS